MTTGRTAPQDRRREPATPEPTISKDHGWQRLRDRVRLRVGLLPFGLKRLRSPAAMAVILAGTVVTLALSALSATPDGCSDAGLRCGIAGGLATSLGLFVFGFALVAIVAAQVVNDYLREIQCNAESTKPRDSQTLLLAQTIRRAKRARDVQPAIIVGESGAGRSTALRQIACELARASWIPVMLSLRSGEPFIGFREPARRAFLDAIDLDIASEDEGERIWRRVFGSGRLVLLVDDLHRLPELDAPRVRAAFEDARSHGYAIVATSRPHGVPRGLGHWVTELGRLTTSQALELVLAAASAQRPQTPVPAEQEEHIRELITRGRLGESPYYVAVLASLASSGTLAAVGTVDLDRGVDELRRSVLDIFVKAYVAGDLAHDDHSTTAERERALSTMTSAARQALLLGERATLDPQAQGVPAAIEAGLLSVEQPDQAQVRHAVLQDYLASRDIKDEQDCIGLIASDVHRRDALTTVRFWAARADRPERAACIYDALVARGSAPQQTAALVYLTTAAVIAATASLAHIDGPSNRDDAALAKAFAEAWEDGDLLDRRTAVRHVATLRSRERFAVLSRCAGDPDYAVRWAAAEGLFSHHPALQNGHEADVLDCETIHSIVRQPFDAAIAVAEQIAAGTLHPTDVDDWDERVRPLVGLGWVLPVLGAVAADPELATTAWDYFDRMVYLFTGRKAHNVATDPPLPAVPDGGITAQLGPEATIAQGLKSAARLVDETRQRDVVGALELMGRLCGFFPTTQFWYSQVVLVHGLAELTLTLSRRAGDSCGAEWRTVQRLVAHAEGIIDGAAFRSQLPRATGSTRASHHPFVAGTAALASTGLAQASTEPDDGTARLVLREHVWADEAEAIASGGGTLQPPAIRLVGAITTLLNLIERGDRSQRLELPRRADLPACLARGEIPRLLLASDDSDGGCVCDFDLCARRPPSSRGAVREITRAFCQREQAAAGEAVPGWETSVSTSEIRQFWIALEHRSER